MSRRATPKAPARRGRINISSRQVFDVLVLVARAPAPVTLGEVTRTLEIPRSTAHRALATLEGAGFLHRVRGGTKFAVGLAALEVCHALFERFRISQIAHPYLVKLAGATGETTALNVRVGWFSLRVAGIEGHHAVHRRLNLGASVPMHASTSGRSILAFTEEGLDAYVRSGLLSTEGIEEDTRRLAGDMAQIREQGYALGALIYPEARAISFPLRDSSGVAHASITITGAAGKFDPTANPELLEAWRSSAVALEDAACQDPDGFEGPFTHLALDEIDLTWSLEEHL